MCSMLRFRDRPPVLAWLVTGFIAAFMAVGVWAMSLGIARGNGGDIGFGVLFIAVSAPFLLFVVSQERARVLSDTTLSIPTLFGHRDIDLVDVANVALLRVAGRRTAWFLVVWTVDEKQRSVGVATPTKLGKGWRDELTGDYLANSRAGRPAVAIWQRARAAQGGSGPLDRVPVADRLQHASTTTAYWTPADGAAELQRPGTRRG